MEDLLVLRAPICEDAVVAAAVVAAPGPDPVQDAHEERARGAGETIAFEDY